MWVSRREFEEYKHTLYQTERKLELLTNEVSGLRSDVRSYAKVGGTLLALAALIAPFVATYTAQHIH